MTDHLPTPAHPLRGLLTPGPRLGWRYQDPAAAMTPYAEVPPPPPALPAAPVPGPTTGQLLRRLAIAGGLGLAGTGLLACCGFLAAGPSGAAELGTQIKLTAALLGAGTLALLGLIVWRHQVRGAQASAAVTGPQRQHEAAVAAWYDRAGRHDVAEAARVAALPVWQAAGPQPTAGRLDIVGGTQFGWRDLLTVAGAGYLASRGPSTIVDLTGDQVCADLRDLCAGTQISVDWQTPPGDSDLLADLDSRQVVDVLIESVHGDGDRELRGQRAADSRILSAVVEALDGQVTLGRVADALRVLLRIPGPTPTLSAVERLRIADELFAPDYLATAAVSLQRLEAHLHPLRSLTTAARTPAVLTVMGAVTDGTSAHSELLDDLIVGWVTRRVATRPELCRTLVVAGADDLAGRHVERLADICARQGVTLILLWRHLRGAAQQALGGGAVAFMRLRNADEATAAADFIGRGHRFVLSGLTRTVGESTSHTDTTGTSYSRSTGANTHYSRAGRVGRLIDHAQAWTSGQGSTTGTSHTTSTQTSVGTGTSWSDASSTQRVYEHIVEPTVLQGLPEDALLFVEHHRDGVIVQALDCNPAIVTLPGVNMTLDTHPAAGVPQQRTATAVGHTPPAPLVSFPPPAQRTAVAQQRAELWSDPNR